MRFNNPRRGDSGIVVRTVSAIVFLAFCALWLYCFQSDVLAVAQHTLSGGITHYDRTVGTVIITVALWLLQLFVYKLVPLRNHLHALTYFPSMLALALLGVVSGSRGVSPWWLLLPLLLLVVWAFVAWTLCRMLKYDNKVRAHLFSRCMWVNMVVMAFMIMGVAMVANTNAVYHYRAQMESQLAEQRLNDALATGEKSLESDAGLTMLRAYVLSRRGELADRLFQYPVVGSSSDLVPATADSRSRALRYPHDSIYAHLGAIPRPGMTTRRYLAALEHGHQATAAVRDYVLCGLLIDRDLDGFARTISKYYDVSDSVSLPRHYREALVLYTHQRAHPHLVYHHAVTDEDYQNLQELEAKYADPNERKIRVLEDYFGSYWYYFKYMK